MAKKVSGLTVAIKADTTGVTSGLKDLTSQSMDASKQLRTVNDLLKLDPTNTELLAQKQALLADSVDTARQKLDALRGAQNDVQAAFERGDITREQYIAFQEEIVRTEDRMRGLESQADNTGAEIEETGQQSERCGVSMRDVLAAGADIAVEALSKAVDVGKALVGVTGDVAAYGDTIDKASQKMGISAQAYQEWDAVLQHSGTSISVMTSSAKKLAKAVQDPTEDSAAAFEKLGISVEEAAKMSQEDLFSATIAGLQKMESGTERTALATTLLGNSAMELGPLLNTSAEETEAMKQRVHELGGVMSDDAVKASAAYRDSLQDMKTAFAGVKNSIGAEMMPAMTEMMDALAGLATGDEKAVENISRAINQIITSVNKVADQVIEIAAKLIPDIVTTIVKNLPKVAKGAMKLVKSFAEAIMKSLPEVLSAAVEIVKELAKGLTEALPVLLPSIVRIVMDIAMELTSPKMLGELVNAALTLMIALTDGLIAAIPELIDRLPEIMDNIVETLIDNVPKLLEAAGEIIGKLAGYLTNTDNLKKIGGVAWTLITKLVDGIVSFLWKVKEGADKMVRKIVDSINLGEYWEAGCQVIDEFMGGVKEKWEAWSGFWEDIGESIYDFLHPGQDGYIDEDAVFQNPYEPAMASGGIVTRPMHALVGEAGPEAVIPLNGGTLDALAKRLNESGAGGGLTVGSITINAGAGADGRAIANDFINAIDERLRALQISQARGIGGTAWHT